MVPVKIDRVIATSLDVSVRRWPMLCDCIAAEGIYLLKEKSNLYFLSI